MSGDEVWQDRLVEIDLDAQMYELRVGELLAGKFSSVEDSKENQRIMGVLTVTNLRVLWHACTAPRVNLSIGMDCISKISHKHIKSKIEGLVETVKILTHCGEDRKEFVFKCASKTSQSISSALNAVHKSYNETKSYRLLRLRNPMEGVSSFQVLPREHICSNFTGVCNLSEDQGYIGSMVITNLRIFWFALNNYRHNVSLPYMQVKSVYLQNSKFGLALTLQSTQVSNSYKFGFRMDPTEVMAGAQKQIKKLIETFRHKPDFGVDVSSLASHIEKEGKEEGSVEEKEEGGGELATANNRRDVYSVLYSVGKSGRGEVEYNEELGLMIEKLPQGVELQSLCRVLG